MNKKPHQIIVGILIFIIAAAVALLAFQTLYQVDNKYSKDTPQAKDGVLTLSTDAFLKNKVLPLVDGWAFYNGEQLTPERIKEEHPQPIDYLYIGEYPDFSMNNRLASPYGTATYGLKIINEGDPQVLSVTLQELFSSADIYINGERVERLGETDPNHYKPYIKNSAVSFQADAETEILIVTTNYSHYYSGMIYPPILGQALDIGYLVLVNQLFYGFLCCSSLVIALFTLVVWASPAKNRLFFYYGLMALAFGLNVAYSPLRWLGIPFTQSLYALEDCSRYVMIFCIIGISSIIAQLKDKGIYRYFVFPISLTLCVVTAVIPLILLPLAPWILPYYGALLDVYQGLVFIYLMGAAIVALKKEDLKVYFLMAVNAVFGMSLLVQFTNTNRFEPVYTGWPLEYAGFTIVLLFGLMMIWYYRSILLQNKKLTEKLEEEVDLRTKELTALMHERKNFLSDLAHDLKAPVSAIQAFIELVKCGNVQVDEELRTYLEIINQKSNEVQNKVQSLQAFTSKDEMIMQKKRMDLGVLLDEFYANNNPDTQANGILFNVIKPIEPIWIMGNAEMLDRAFENLLYNAMSYTPINGKIEIKVADHDENVKITFSDTGTGIPAETIPKIFDRFFSTRVENGVSQGLGLFIVRYVIKAHGGTVEVSSKMGVGTVFSILLKRF